MEFKEYQHIERFGTDEVEDIEIGTCYVFPKIDGTNSSVWLNDEGIMCAGSRHRQLSLENDNANFYDTMVKTLAVSQYLCAHPTHRLYGEFLIPHSLKTYREDAWRRFYVFDVCVDKEDGGLEYIPYDIYQPWLEEFCLDYVSPIRIIKNGDYEWFIKCIEENNFLIKDGAGVGEGIVIKNYSYYNKYGRQTWAKIVTAEFKEKHYKAMGAPVSENKMIEEKIVEKYVTSAFVDKEYAKIVLEKGNWVSPYIPMLLGKVFYELIHEEMWNIIKEFKNPKIDFKILNLMTIAKIKEVKREIFG